MMKTARLRTALILPCLLALTACGAEQESIEQWMQHAGKDLQGKVEPLPPVQPYELYPFQSAQLGSPFDPARLQLARNKVKGLFNSNRPREALENYELSQLKLTGTLRFNKQYFGLILAPDNRIYRVSIGNFIGPNFGIVRKVSETEVVLEETVESINGEWVQQENKFYLTPQQNTVSDALKKTELIKQEIGRDAFKQNELIAKEATTEGHSGAARRMRLNALQMLPLQDQATELEALANEAESVGHSGEARKMRQLRNEVLYRLKEQGTKP